MGKILKYIVASFFLVPVVGKTQTKIWVSPTGNDHVIGTESEPLASIQMAIRQARNLRRTGDSNIGNGIHIVVKGGHYFLNEPITIRPEDSGTPQSYTTIESNTGENVVLSGGVLVKDWKSLTQPVKGLSPTILDKIKVAELPENIGIRAFDFRQLWVNGRKAVRAKSSAGNTMHRILDWDKKTATAVVASSLVKSLEAAPGLEFFIHQWWETANLRVRKLEKNGDSCRVYFYEPESRIQNEHPWPSPWLSTETGNSAFYFVNSIQLLDEPGEWFYDADNKKIYYYPLPNENMNTAEVVVPVLEKLLEIRGTNEFPVENVSIKGLTFQNSTWLRPSQEGHVPHQTGMYMLDAYKLKPAGTKEKAALENQAWIGRPAAAVDISYAKNIELENNKFLHLAATGVDLREGVSNSLVIGNLFEDIGGTGLLGGNFGEQGLEIHRPFLPKNENIVCQQLTVKNNFVTDAANEDWGAVGIGFGYARNITIANNEIENVPYSGISMGWGWTPQRNIMQDNVIRQNKIHHYGRSNYDCAGIYTLSAQPGTIIENNDVDSIFNAPYAHLSTHWFYLYTDEGSSGITIKNNWTPSQKYLQNNNGPGNIWENNGPQVSDEVKRNAGLESAYRFLAANKTSHLVAEPINKERKELIEMIAANGKPIDTKKISAFLKERGVKNPSIYQWKNHVVIYSFIQDLSVLRGKLQKLFDNVSVKVYQNLMYDFERKEHCNDDKVTDDWETIMMTADLVTSPEKQQEYLQYHATQFEKWPEVARGFCNAEFQQLLVFKNQRQLMLLISIPKGKSLDKLNPKTSENNPRVDEWNKIMAQYQQGIEGTKKGEVWVLLKQVQ